MENNVCNLIADLVDYAVREGLCEETDRTFYHNILMSEMGGGAFAPDRAPIEHPTLDDILGALCDLAIANGVIED